VRSLGGGALGATGCDALLRGGEVGGGHLGALGSRDAEAAWGGRWAAMVLYGGT
jgi:hypothetical protein